MPRELNIRSDEAYEIAHRAAREPGKSVTELVTDALRARHGPSARKVSPEQAAETFKMLMQLAREGGQGKKPGATSNHDDLYGAFGLPK
jgi:hypothetical protein